MNEIFNFHGQDVRTLTIDNEPWFVGKDVADILGYAKPLDAISRHVDEDDSVKYGLTDNLGRTQNTIIINESGLYSLILSSKLPQAKEFKRWVTSEVLPAPFTFQPPFLAGTTCWFLPMIVSPFY